MKTEREILDAMAEERGWTVAKFRRASTYSHMVGDALTTFTVSFRRSGRYESALLTRRVNGLPHEITHGAGEIASGLSMWGDR